MYIAHTRVLLLFGRAYLWAHAPVALGALWLAEVQGKQIAPAALRLCIEGE